MTPGNDPEYALLYTVQRVQVVRRAQSSPSSAWAEVSGLTVLIRVSVQPEGVRLQDAGKVSTSARHRSAVTMISELDCVCIVLKWALSVDVH